EPQRRPERERRERADHEDLAVGEVDQLDDSVDERVAERDERPDRPVRQAVGEVVPDAGEVPVVDEVLNAVVGRKRDQDRDQAVLRDELAYDLRPSRLKGLPSRNPVSFQCPLNCSRWGRAWRPSPFPRLTYPIRRFGSRPASQPPPTLI